MKLNLGAGRDVRTDGKWVNVDCVEGPNIDLVLDLDQPKPFELARENTVDEFLVSHLIEHITYPLPLLESMWRAAKPDALAVFRCPYGSSDDADEDPTHVRRMFIFSWGYFGQPFYWKADYGYRGDWQVEKVVLYCNPDRVGSSEGETLELISMERNVVLEMEAHLRAVKPLRPQERVKTNLLIDLVTGARESE